MNETLKTKLKDLPNRPGVYFHKDINNQIIYIGKAAVLKNRVRQYFQSQKSRDPKTQALIKEIYDIDWMCVDSEIEALFLEAEMIRRYMPRYNILLRDDKALSYIRIDYNNNYPTVTTTRRPLDDGAKYFGPYFSLQSVRNALKTLRKIFPFASSKSYSKNRASLYYHLGLDPGLEENKTTLAEYRANLRKLIAVIEGKKATILKQMEKEMKQLAKKQQFEQAAKLRNRIIWLNSLNRQVIFSDKEFIDISKDHALSELVTLFHLSDYPRRIEGMDISHMQGTNVVASLVVFTNGVSDKAKYRKFKTKSDKNNDFDNMNETIGRRLSAKNVKAWGLPDLMIIDGGKGQLDSAIKARNDLGYLKIPFIGLAKKREQIIIHNNHSALKLNENYLKKLNGYASKSLNYTIINLPPDNNLIKLLQRIRDESHRFAVSYHSVLKIKAQKKSVLDDLPGVGPKTRRKLIKTFGSLNAIKEANEKDVALAIGPAKAHKIKRLLVRTD